MYTDVELIAEVQRRWPDSTDRPQVPVEKMSKEYLAEMLAARLDALRTDVQKLVYAYDRNGFGIGEEVMEFTKEHDFGRKDPDHEVDDHGG